MKQIRTTAITIAIIFLAAFARPVHAADIAVSDASAQTNATQVEEDTRPEQLRAYLAAKNSPLTDDAAVFVRVADKLDINWKLVAAIAGVESTFGKHIPTGSYNAWGWGVFTGKQDGIHFTSWEDGITKVSEGLRYNYIDKGAATVDDIGRIYAASPTWSYKVKWMIADIEKFTERSQDALEVSF